MMTVVVLYDGKEVGRVVTNRSLTTEELVRLAGIDLKGRDPYGSQWAWELFESKTL